MCGKKQHTKAEIRSEMSELICGRIAAGENYNLTRDTTLDMIGNKDMLRELAIETCTCPEAQLEAKRKLRIENVDEKVNKMLGQESDTPVENEILELIKQMSIHICFEKIKKMSISINSSVKVSISTDMNGLLDIKKEIKNVSRQKI